MRVRLGEPSSKRALEALALVVLLSLAVAWMVAGEAYLLVALIAGGPLALAGLWLAVRRRSALPYLLVAVIGLDSLVLFPGSTGVQTLTRPVFAVLLGLYVLSEIVERRIRATIQHGLLVPPALLLVGYMAASLVWSDRATAGLSTALTLVQLLVLFWLAAHMVRTSADLTRALSAWILYGLVVSLVSTALLYLQVDESAGPVRVSALGQNPNATSVYIVMAFGALVGLAAFPAGSSCFRRARYWLPTVIALVVGLVANASRGGILALAIMTLVGLVLLWYQNARQGFLLTGALGVVLLLFLTVLPGPLLNLELRLGWVSDNSVQDRLAFAQVALDLLAEHPLIGVGLTSLPYENLTRTGWSSYAHNTYLTVLAEGGLAGGVLLALWWGAAFAAIGAALGRERTRRDPSLRAATWGIGLVLCSASLGMLVSDLITYKAVWLSFGLAQAAYSLSLEGAGAERPVSAPAQAVWLDKTADAT